MPGLRHATRARAAQAPRPDGRAASGGRAAGPEHAGSGPQGGEPRPGAPGAGLRDLFRGLRAGDLDTLLLTVEIAADGNLMPSADPAEAARILAFLARLAEHDAALPPPSPDGPGTGPEGPPDAC